LSARATARVSEVSAPAGAALGAATTARGSGELGVDGGAAELSGAGGTGVTAATGGAELVAGAASGELVAGTAGEELVAGTAGEELKALTAGAGGGDASARSIAGRTGRAGGGWRSAAAARREDTAGRRADGTEARVGGCEIVFCGAVGAATGTSTFSGLSTAATRSAVATVAGGLSVTLVDDTADPESRTTSSCGSN